MSGQVDVFAMFRSRIFQFVAISGAALQLILIWILKSVPASNHVFIGTWVVFGVAMLTAIFRRSNASRALLLAASGLLLGSWGVRVVWMISGYWTLVA